MGMAGVSVAAGARFRAGLEKELSSAFNSFFIS